MNILQTLQGLITSAHQQTNSGITMKIILFALLTATNVYALCLTDQAQVSATVLSVMDAGSECLYEVEVGESSPHALCALSSSTIESHLISETKNGSCSYQQFDQFLRVLVHDKQNDTIYLD